MKCEEAAEFVSALCDGEIILPEAAAHIGQCRECHALLKDFVEMGAELRRTASLVFPQTVRAQTWERGSQTGVNLWRKGWETMRIPKFAFATLLVVILALGSGLVITKVRAHVEEPVMMLTISPEGGVSIRCAILIDPPQKGICGGGQTVNSAPLFYEFRVLGREGDRIHLGIRAMLGNASGGTANNAKFASEPQKQYWFEPGQTLEIEVTGLGAITVTGEFMDHMPSVPGGDEVLDPKPDELRVVSPLLVRDNKVVLDFAGMTLIADTGARGVQMYKSGLGRYVLSLSPLKGAAEGKVEQSRIFFGMDGHAYQLLTGAPVARSERVWVLYQPQYKPSRESPGQGDDSDFGGGVELKKLGDLVVQN
jgi:hypothetical protein